MGVWGISNLENDTAKDWLVEIGDKYIIADIYAKKILAEENFIDDEESFITLAVLELMERQILSKYFDKNRFLLKNPENFIFSILNASKKILNFSNHSELRELWKETDEYDEWKKYQESLINNVEFFFKNL